MDSKLNYSAIEVYSVAYTRKIVNSFFGVEESINGKQILSLTNLQQVNLLVIKNLFEKWNKETSKFRSPYFNYDSEEVKKALENFMNVLSNNINVKKSHFEPLLKKSVTDTILLVFAPYVFYSKEINHPERSRISINNLREMRRYIKVNNTILDRLISRFKQDDIEEVFNDEGFDILNDVMEESDLPKENWDEYLYKFSEVQPLSLSMIFQDAEDDHVDEDFDRPLVKNESKALGDKNKAAKSINDQFYKEQKTLHEQLAQRPAPTIAELHQHKIDSLKKFITLNQKFMFVRELFSGNHDAYHSALEKLEQCDSLETAQAILNRDYIGKYNWNMEGEEVSEFMDILIKRFR